MGGSVFVVYGLDFTFRSNNYTSFWKWKLFCNQMQNDKEVRQVSLLAVSIRDPFSSLTLQYPSEFDLLLL